MDVKCSGSTDIDTCCNIHGTVWSRCTRVRELSYIWLYGEIRSGGDGEDAEGEWTKTIIWNDRCVQLPIWSWDTHTVTAAGYRRLLSCHRTEADNAGNQTNAGGIVTLNAVLYPSSHGVQQRRPLLSKMTHKTVPFLVPFRDYSFYCGKPIQLKNIVLLYIYGGLTWVDSFYYTKAIYGTFHCEVQCS